MLNKWRSANPISQTWHDVGRFRVIITVLIKHGFGEMISQINQQLQDNFITRLLGREAPPGDEGLSIAKRLSRVFQELGPTFIKLGQILSTRPDLITEEYIEEFKKLQMQAAPLPFGEIAEQIESSLQRPLEELFAYIEEEPLASASIAQVHVAKLHDQTEVVVKVLRPGIRDVLFSDLSILKFLAKQLTSLFPDTALFDPVGIAEEFERALSKEIDFSVEFRNLQRFRRNFEQNPEVHIPIAYKEYSCDSVLVMERIHGIPVTSVTEDQQQLLRRLLRAVFEMIYVHAFFHGDLHPGNILIEENGRIALIDFGLVGRLTPRMRNFVIDLLLGILRHDYESVAETLYEIGTKKVAIDYERFQSDVSTLLDEHLLGATMADIEFGVLLQDILDGALRHNIAVPPNYTMMFKALITAEGVGKQLDPDMNLIEALEPYVKELIKQRYTPDALMKQGVRFASHLSRFLKQFPITARQVLMGIENGRIKFGLDSEQLAQFMQEYRRQGALKLSVALSGILLLIATFSVDQGAPGFFGISTLSLLCYIFGGALATWVLYNIIRDR